MEAGKHVLIEKPLTSNAEEARQVHAAALKTGKVAVEAFHWRFHPAAHHIKQIVDSGEHGRPTSIYARLVAPAGTFNKDDIRFNYKLGGGACMDLTYVFCASAYYASPDITKTTFHFSEMKTRLHSLDKRIDEAFSSKFVIEQEGRPPVKCEVEGDQALAPLLGFIPRFWAMSPVVNIELEKAKIEFDNFVVPSYSHSITITEKDSTGKLTGKKHTEKLWTNGPQWGSRGEPWWTTYRYQLEAFVDAVRAKQRGQEYHGPWMSFGESEKVMELIDGAYDKAGLPRRGI